VERLMNYGVETRRFCSLRVLRSSPLAVACPSRRHQSRPPSSSLTLKPSGEFVSPLRRTIAPDTIAIDDIDLAPVRRPGRLLIDFSMRKAQGARYVRAFVGSGWPHVHDDDIWGRAVRSCARSHESV